MTQSDGLATRPPTAPVRAGSPGGLIIMDKAAILERVKVIHEIMDELMVEGHHYHSFGTTKRKIKNKETGEIQEMEVAQYSLGKPGAELVCLTFGLTPDIESVLIADDPNATRIIQVGQWVDDPARAGKQKKILVDQPATGYYEVKSTCAIWDRDGRLLARASGSCNSNEAAFLNQGYSNVKNSILKRSEKRAMVAAVLMASGAGDVFVQDLEDLPEGFISAPADPRGSPTSGSARAGASSSGGWLSEGRRKLIFAKGKARELAPAVIDWMIARLESMGQQKGLPFFNNIADEKKPEADTLWSQAVSGAAGAGKDAPAAPAGAPAPAGDPPAGF